MNLTMIRAVVLALLALVGLFAPNLIPEGTKEAIADHATTVVSAVLGLWALFASHRIYKERDADTPDTAGASGAEE